MALPDRLRSVGKPAQSAQARASGASAVSGSALAPPGFHASMGDQPSCSDIRRAARAFRTEMPGSEVVTARVRPGSAR